MNHENTKDTKTHEGRYVENCLAASGRVRDDGPPGLLESVYPRAVAIELEDRGISFEMEKPLRVNYRGQLLCHQRLDMFIDGRLVLELKSVEMLHPVHVAQVVSYLRLTKSRLGLLINFNVPILKQGIRRIVL